MKPKLRFKKFTDEWEEKKLGEIANVIMGQSPNSDSYNKNNKGLPLIQGNADIKNGKTIRRIFTTCPTKVCDKNTLIMTVRAPVGELGIATDKVCIGRGICAIISPLQIYIYHYLKAKKEKWTIYSQGSTFEAVNSKDIKDFKIQLPSFQEQEKISKFFSLLDQRIEKQERKVALLKEEKKGYMQKLFKQGLRFKDEQGNDYPDWEEKKFLDSFSLIIDYRGKTPKKLGLDWGNGNIKALSALNVKKGYIDWNADVHMGSEDLYSAWMKKGDLKQDDILFTTEAPLGNTALIPDNKKYILSQRVIALRTNENCNPKFIFQCMNDFTFENQIQKRSTGTTAKGINQKGLSKIKIQLPSLPEQEKIANFLSLLDQRIEKEQEKLKLMKEEKQGLMQRMFV